MVEDYNRQQLKSGNLYFFIIVLFFPFGLLLYNFFNIQYIDEVMVLLLSIYWVVNKGLTRKLLLLLIIFVFYLLYSLFITKINGKIAPFYDLQQQIKPYIILLATLSLKPRFQRWQVYVIRQIILICAVILFFIYLGGESMQFKVLGHSASAAIMSLTLGLYYLYFSDRGKKASIIALIIILCGLFSLKFKLFGEACIFIAIYFFLKKKILKINFKYIVYGILLCICIVYIVWDKFYFYYVQGFSEGSGLARPILYMTSMEILYDYIPFGCGLGSFANEASRVFYSPIYEMYGIDKVFGLSEEEGAPFAADTFFPILAQYGIIGIILFFLFWKYIYKKIINIDNFESYKIGLILFATLFIESTSDSSMLSNRGVLILILLGLCCNDKLNSSYLKKQ